MGEWSSYGLSDFLMFSPQAYWRLVERYNTAWWPGQLLALGLGLVALLANPRAPRSALLLMAAAWAWVGWAFHWNRYAEIFIGAPGLAIASDLQAGLLVAAAMLHRLDSKGHRAGLFVGVVALVLHPASTWLEGTWRQAEVFGFMPDPTALVTLGVLLACPLPRWQRALLGVFPVVTLALGLLTRSQFG